MSKSEELLKKQRKEFLYKKLVQLLNKLPEERRELYMSELNDEKRLFISPREFSDVTGVPEETVRKWLRKRIVQGTHMGQKWLIPKSEIDRIMAEATKK